MKRLIIAEKPSMASDLAKALGKFQKHGNYYENEEMVIASAIGHILELYMPSDFDPALKTWSFKTLPILPKNFKLKPIERSKEYFSQLKKLLARSDIGEVINACDAGREGELIFTYIIQQTKCKKPIKRLWLSSMTPTAIREGFKHLLPNEEMISLQEAARCRSESDWLIGINGTRAITKKLYAGRIGQVATVGRVQTPTLTLVYEREKAIRNFKPRPYWKILATFEIPTGTYQGIYQKPDFDKKNKKDSEDQAERIWEKETANTILEEIKSIKEAQVSEKKKRSKVSPPLLYDLTTLQREANSRFGMPARVTLKIAQSLYEKHKVLTYPRTNSKVLPEDYVPTTKQTLSNIKGVLEEYAQKALSNNWVVGSNKRIFNNAKVTDHFAIIPTGELPKKLSPDEAKIYEMVCRRFIAVFFPPAEFDVTTRNSLIKDHLFKTEGRVLVELGWMEVQGKTLKNEEGLPALDSTKELPQTANVKELNLEEEETRPPARYTEATLLSAMEHAGKLVEDEEHAEAMKESGLGTPATRAQILEHLIQEKYLLRDQRELKTTIKAELLIEFLKLLKIEYLTSPSLTGEWEHKLAEMEKGKITRKNFMQGITEMATQIVEQSREFKEDNLEKTPLNNVTAPTDNLPMLETFSAYISQDGKMKIYKNMGNRFISPEELKELIEKGQIGPLDDFRSKQGKPFSAILRLDENYKAKFDFGNATKDAQEAASIDYSQLELMGECPMAQKGSCGATNGKVYATPTAYQCNNYQQEGTPQCKFRVNRNLLSRAIPQDQFKKLLTEGKTDLLDKFKSNRTKRFFSAHIVLKKDGTIGFEFAPPKKKTAKKKSTASSTKS